MCGDFVRVAWFPGVSSIKHPLSSRLGGNPAGGFLPGASTLSGLGIRGLPQDTQSALGRATNSVISVKSPESAQRLARPPSVCSSLQLQQPPAPQNLKPALGGGTYDATGKLRRYEKRGTATVGQPQTGHQPQQQQPPTETSGVGAAPPTQGEARRSPTPAPLVGFLDHCPTVFNGLHFTLYILIIVG